MDAQGNEVTVSFHTAKAIPPEALKELYDSQPWWPERRIPELQQVLESFPAVGAWDGEKLIGFARAVTDYEFRAYIEDVLVLEGYREKGVGTRMLNLLTASLNEIDVITLFCQRKLVPYYESLGFKELTRQVVMQKRNTR